MNMKYIRCGIKHKWRPYCGELTDFQFVQYKNSRAFPADCNLDRKRVDMLKKRILNGDALLFNWALVFVQDANTIYRINGKHSKEAIQELISEGRIMLSHAGLWVCIPVYEVKTMDEARRLYQYFDDPDLPRAFEERIRSETYDDPILGAINKDTVSAFASALHEIENGTHPASIEEKTRNLKTNYRDFVTRFLPLFEGNTSTLRKSPVIKAMFQQFSRCPDRSVEFWSAVVDSSLSRGDTPARLYDYLSKHKVYRGVGVHHKDAVSADEMQSMCHVFWNAWIAGKKRFNTKIKPGRIIKPLEDMDFTTMVSA